MRAPLRGTGILKSRCCRVPRVWHPPRAIWRRGLHIATSSTDALDILPSEPVPSTSGATPGLFKNQTFNRVLIVMKMPNSRSLAPHFLSSLCLSQPLKISTLGKVHWSELEGSLRMYRNLDCLRLLPHAENEVGSVNPFNTGAVS